MMWPVARLSSCISSQRENKQCGVRIKVSFEMLSSNGAEGTDSSSAERGSLCFSPRLTAAALAGTERGGNEGRKGMEGRRKDMEGRGEEREERRRNWRRNDGRANCIENEMKRTGKEAEE